MKAEQLNTHRNKLGLYAALVSFFFIHYIVFPTPVALGGDLPENPVVQAGAPTITTNGLDMTVNAGAADKTWIDWQGGFNIGAQNSVNNIGPGASAVILHNDVSGAISNIQGALNGNCNVFLLNPSGILFGVGAQVNVGGLVVSTLRMSMDDFMSGNYSFNSDGIANMGSIVNAGTITTQTPAGVTFLGGAIKNEGVINANLGTVNLVSGSEVTLNANNDGSIQVAVNKQVLNNVYDKDGNRVSIGVENVGSINANGGQVFIEAEAVNDVFDTLINQSGVVKAGSMVQKDGKIVLISNSEGIVQNTGTLDTSAVEAGAKGGSIEMRGEMVGQFGTVKADAIDGDGGNIELRASKVVALGTESITTANAGLNGDGGNVIVFSPDTALFMNGAEIEAKGGQLSGDGGFVEVSGRQSFVIEGMVDTSAYNGSNGTLYIDPVTLTIDDGTNDPLTWAGNTWTNGTGLDTTTMDVDVLISYFTTGNVIIDAITGGEGGTGNITLNAGKNLTNATANSLTLTGNDITLTSGINFSGSGDLILDGNTAVAVNDPVVLAGGDFTSTGTTFTSDATGTITTGGGAVNLSGHTGAVAIGAAVSTSGGTFTSGGTTFDNTGGTITTGAGSVTINQAGAVTIGANISTDNDINIDTASTFAATAGVTITGGGDGDTFTIDAAGITLNGAGGGQLIQTGSGTIALNATGASNISLADSSIAIADGTLTLTAGGTINGSATGVAEIDADGNITLTADGIGNTAQVEITGDAGGDHTLTIISTAAAGEAINIQMLTDQLSAVSLTLSDADSGVDIDLSGGDLIDINGAAATSTINNVVTNNLGVGFTYVLSEAANVAINNIDASTGIVSITASNGTLTVTNAGGGITTTTTGDVTLSSSGAIAINDPISAGDDTTLTSTASSVTVADTVAAGSDGTGSLAISANSFVSVGNSIAVSAGNDITYDAITYIDIGTDGTHTSANGKIDFDANAAHTTAVDGHITIGNNTTFTSAGNIIFNASDAITVNGSISPGGLIDFVTGVSGDDTNEGKFVMGANGVVNTHGSLIIGASSILDNIQIVNPGVDVGDDAVDIAGTINASGDVTIDLNTATLEGDINLTGAIIADDNVTLAAYSTAAYVIEGSGDITADQITLTTNNAASNLTVNDLAAREWIAITSGQNITTGNLSAEVNAGGGNAIKITTTDGDVVINGTTRATAISGLDVTIDPADITINGSVEVTGDYTITATEDITVNANITSTGGNISLTAGSDAGDILIMGTGTILSSSVGTVSLAAYDMSLYNVNAYNSISWTAGNDILLYGIVRSDGNVSLTATAGSILNVASDQLIVGSTVDLAAADGIFVNTAAGTLEATNSGTGAINIVETDSVTLSATGLNATDGDVTLTTINGTIDGSTNDSVINGTKITLTANGAVSYLTTGDTQVTATDDVALGGTALISIGSGGVSTDGGSLTINGGTVWISGVLDTSAAAADGGNVDITSFLGEIYIVGAGINANGGTNCDGGNITLISADVISFAGTTTTFFSANGGAGAVDGGWAGDITITAPNGITLGTIQTTANITAIGGDGGTGDGGAGGNITLNTNLTFSEDLTINSSSGTGGTPFGDGNISVTGTINATNAAADTLTLTADGGDVTLGNSIGDTLPLEALVITSTGVTTLNNTIITNGADAVDDLDLSGATQVQLASNVSLRSANQEVKLNTVNGAFDLTVYAGTDITLGAAIGGVNPLHDISMTAGNTITSAAITARDSVTLTTASGAAHDITLGGAIAGDIITIDGDRVDINFAITGVTSINITSRDAGAAGDDIELGADLDAASVVLNAGGSGSTVITVTQDNTLGSTTYNGPVTINGGTVTLTSLTNMVFDGNVTVTAIAAGGITSTNGSLDFNGTINGAQAINLDATKGKIALMAVGDSTSPTSLDLDSLTAELAGNINVDGNVDLSGVGLTTLTGNVTITASGSGNAIQLGNLDGAKDLTLIANHATDGDVILNDANIGSLTMTDANDITFNGNFVTSGVVNITGIDGAITVTAATDSIRAGGAVTLTTSGTVVDNGTISGNSVGITGATSLNGSVNATNGSVTFNSVVTLTGNSIASSTNADVIFIADILDDAATSDHTLTVNAGNKADFQSTIGAGQAPLGVTVTAANTDFHGAVSVATGGLRVNGSGGTTTILDNITSGDDIIINDSVIISGVRTLTSGLAAGNDIYILGTINATAAATDSLTLAAGSGNVTLMNSVGNSVQLEDLTITSIGITTLNNTIDVNGDAAGEDIDLGGATNVVLGSDLTLDSVQNVILEAVNGQGHDLTVIAGDTINLTDAITNVRNVAMQSGSSLALDFAVTALQNATFTTTAAASDITVTAALTAGTMLRLTTAGVLGADITIGTGNDLESPTVLLDAGLGTVTNSAAINNSDGSLHTVAAAIAINANITAADDILLEGAVTAGGDLTAGDDLTINGITTLATGARIFTSTNGDIDLNGNVLGAQGLTLSAANGTIYVTTIGVGTPVGALVISGNAAELDGAISATSVDTTGVGLTTLTGNVTITASGSGNAIQLGNLDGAKDLTLIANHATD
ncbi:MAG: filamentous hemagglutinin N-terminal domain-containing protein, partial [Candidatus Omnitrophota bacterium]